MFWEGKIVLRSNGLYIHTTPHYEGRLARGGGALNLFVQFVKFPPPPKKQFFLQDIFPYVLYF